MGIRRDSASLFWLAVATVAIAPIVLGASLLALEPEKPGEHYFELAYGAIALGALLAVVVIGGLVHVWMENQNLGFVLHLPISIRRKVIEGKTTAKTQVAESVTRIADAVLTRHRTKKFRGVQWETYGTYTSLNVLIVFGPFCPECLAELGTKDRFTTSTKKPLLVGAHLYPDLYLLWCPKCPNDTTYDLDTTDRHEGAVRLEDVRSVVREQFRSDIRLEQAVREASS